MGSPLPSIIIVCTYLMAVYVALPTYMKNRKPLKLTTIIRYYNILQIVCCVALIYMVRMFFNERGRYLLEIHFQTDMEQDTKMFTVSLFEKLH